MKLNKIQIREKANRSLWSTCMGQIGLANSWLIQANAARVQGQSEIDFIAHSHPANRRKACAAYRLAVVEAA